ncbi:MAG: DUF1646 family protein, partial [bacterium]
MTAGLILIFLLVLVLPFFSRKVEHNLEGFLFIMGVLAAWISGVLQPSLFAEALGVPLKITAAVLVFGLLFRALRMTIRRLFHGLALRLSLFFFIFAVIVALGILSSIITAIIAALILVEVVDAFDLDRRTELAIVICGCFAIGLGAVLTPLGEPLSTILVAKLKGGPYHADFLFPLRMFGILIVPGVVICGVAPLFLAVREPKMAPSLGEEFEETTATLIARALRVYVFIMALIFLGAGFKPLVEAYFVKLPGLALYWLNMVSAILDNATLTAAEVGPALALPQIRDAVLGLLISGGMLIPGNIP